MDQSNERGKWTSASNAGPDGLCAGRHLAQASFPDKRTKDAAFGDAIHQALAAQKPDGLETGQADIYEACNNITTKLCAQYFGKDAEKITVFRHRRLWVHWQKPDGTLDMSHSGEPDFAAVYGTKALIIDYKTLAGEVPASPRNMQLRDLSVLLKGQNIITAEVGAAIVQPFVTYEPELCVYNLDDLNRAAMEMTERVRASNNPSSQRTAGEEQCKFCRAKLACGTYQKWHGSSVPQLSSLISVPVTSWSPEQRAEYCDRRTIAYKWLSDCDDAIKEGLTKDPAFVPGFWMEPGDFREPVVKPQELFERFATLGGELPAYLKCVSIIKEKFKEEVSKVTKEKGAKLKATLTNLYRDLTARTQNASSLAKRKDE